MRIGLAQINVTVGDFGGNTKKILQAVDDARSLGVDLLTFPELAICGYPPEDLLLKSQFIEKNLKCLEKIIDYSSNIAIIVGFVDVKSDIYNAAAVIYDKKLMGTYHKIYLPNYGVFDENRYFQAGNACTTYKIAGVNVGVSICEDIWYEAGPVTVQSYAGAEVIVNINASPYRFGKRKFREKMLSVRALDNTVIVVYNNLVGGQDELVFDGNSMVFDEKGQMLARGKSFEEDFITVDLNIDSIFKSRLHDPRRRKEILSFEEKRWKINHVEVSQTPIISPKPSLPPREIVEKDPVGEAYKALVLGTRDYVHKNGFKKVLVGLSGGVDSSLVAMIAVDALGSPNVVGISMPSRYSSEESISDAEILSENLNMEFMTIPIEKIFPSYLETLKQAFKGTKPNVAEENIQARIRGNILMALSNKFGWLVLTTGNKSETATGYCTLYGDMAGGFAVIKDVPKTMVYKLAEHRNKIAGFDLMPQNVLTKPPSAELRPDQKDIDTLPPYDLLDSILQAYVEEDKAIEEIIGMGFDREIVEKAVKLVDESEYKRRQSPPGIKITSRAFGRDRRLPITYHPLWK